MAELLASEGMVKAGSAGAYLRENLPDRYIVVADARPCGQPLAAAVVGRSALFVVEDLDAGEIAPTQAAPVPRRAGGAQAPDGAVAARAAEQFLKDEFPSLALTVVALQGARDWSEGPVTWRVVGPAEWADLPLGDAIVAADGGSAFADDETREELALGLRDRQLSSSQTTRRPFVFPSGGPFRTGARVQSVRQAVAHMDRYPGDSVRVLRDGTLAAWLEEEGALHLAALARDVMRQAKPNLRIALENFLLGTGLVDRPQITARPAQLDLGYAIQGQKASCRLRLEKARNSRGYIFGTVSGGNPWLTVEPREFDGMPVELVVTAETAGLQITGEPYRSDVLLATNASVEPVRLPITLSVVAEPPRLIKHGVRPLVGLLLGCLLGAVLGLLWRATRLVEAQNAVIWMVTLTVIWGMAGMVRATRQPAAWPTRYALPRWLFKVLAWSAGLGILAAIIVQAWRLGLGGGLEFEGLSLAAAAVAGASLGIVFATLDELAESRHACDQEYVHGRRSSRRKILVAAGCIGLLLIALLAPRVITTTMNRAEVQAKIAPARGWVEARWNELGDSMDRIVRELTFWYYNKPASVIGGTPTPEASGSKLLEKLGVK